MQAPRPAIVTALTVLAAFHASGPARSDEKTPAGARAAAIVAGNLQAFPFPLATGTDTLYGYDQKAGSRPPSSIAVRTIERRQERGRDVYRITVTHRPLGRDLTTISITTVLAQGFAMQRQHVRSNADSGDVRVDGNRLIGWTQPAHGPRTQIDTRIQHAVLPDDGIAPWLIGMLPLRDGYDVDLATFNMWSNSENVRRVQVLGSETLPRDGLAADCWKAAAGKAGPPGYERVVWVDKSSRKILQSVLRKGPDDPEYWTITRTPK